MFKYITVCITDRDSEKGKEIAIIHPSVHLFLLYLLNQVISDLDFWLVYES